MYSFCTLEFDLDGDIVIHDEFSESQVHDFKRRVSRTKTLDGGVYINDFGYTSGDRTIELSLGSLSLVDVDNVKRLFKSYSKFIVVTREGPFLANAEGMRYRRGISYAVFLVEADA